jgi:signal transduction histidine kinase/DNA-binding response OmpR family regulator
MLQPAPGRLTRLYAATTALAREALDEAELFPLIVAQAAELLEAKYAALGLLAPDGEHLSHFVTTGLTDEEYEALKDEPPHGRGILGALLREGQPLRLDEIASDPRSVGFPPGHPPMKSFLGVPLHLGGAVIGRLYMTESKKGAFDEADEQLAMGFAAAASVAIGNARLTAEVRAQSAAATVAAGQLRAMLDALDRGVCMTNAEGRIVIVNERLAELLAVEGELVGRSERDLAACFAAPEAFLSALGVEQAQPELTFSDELALAGDAGRTVRRRGAPVLAPDGGWLGRIAVYQDVTQDREVQEQLVQAERLRATGEMASGVAHDFNNLLATILGRVEVMLGQGPEPATGENLLAIQRAARDGASAVARLREYGKPLDATEFRPAVLEALVRQAVELTQPRWRDQAQREGRTIDVDLQLRETRPVMGDAASLRDVLVNLIFNAVDAMPSGGRLTVALAPAGAGAELTVRDTGVGMPPAIQRRIFEPFFTTKGEKGSGLGLATARKVASAHGGRLDVASEPGRGTTFTLWLPTTDAPAEAAEEERGGPMAGRIGRIVVVDDQQDVLDTTAMLLRGDGHDVRVFLDPRQAVASAVADPPDLIISDLGMPGMNGWDVARAVHERHPALPVVLLTGWGREISAQQMRDGGIAAVLPKPVEGPALRAAVASALPREQRPLRVLLVDDSAAFAAVLAMLIGQAGHAVERADSGAGGVERLRVGGFDLALVDAGLPDGGAAEVLAAARALAPAPAVCVVSGSRLAEMERMVPGADLYVEKVRVPEELDRIVAAARARG